MGQALYRKYRSKSLDEIVGQPHITKTLTNALKTGKISHAILLSGPRGVGKTSVARILAHMVNELPYDESATHLDIIEIDAASNRRIDEIRELRDKIASAPAKAKYKVYIIDEVHMLTREAMSALLKTLEEPPAHAIFILATTEAHKLPETIVSRTQKFNFKPIPSGQIAAHLRQIADHEKIGASDEALRLIAEHGHGSFRDAISLLDQAQSFGRELKAGDILSLVGMTSEEGLANLATALEESRADEIVTTLDSLRLQGVSASGLSRQLGRALRAKMLANQSKLPNERLIKLLTKLIEVPASPRPFDLLELLLLETALAGNEAARSTDNQIKNEPPPLQSPLATAAPTPRPAPAAPQPTLAKNPAKDPDKLWLDMLAVIKDRHGRLYSLARMAQPRFEANQLKLYFEFAFHQKRLNQPESLQILGEVLMQLTNQTFKITCLVKAGGEAKAGPKTAVQAEAPGAELQTISNIFGSVEVLD